jgi:class 3 adenylate cyclase
MLPETQYARLGELHLAFQTLGSGPPDLLLLDQWFSHVEAQWEVPPVAEFRERLAAFGRLIMFDKRGTGLSDPVPTAELPSVEQWMADVPAVLDAAGSERAAVIANIGGGIMAISFAAAHPDRVSHLVLVDCFARFSAAPDYPAGAPPEVAAAQFDAADARQGRGIMIDLFAPSLAADERLVRAWSRYERAAASPGTVVAIVRMIYSSDVRALLPTLRVPTLVIHRAGAIGFPVAQGRYLAAHIPGATYVELPGIDNLIWAGDRDAILAEIQAFVTGFRPAPEPQRVLATVLFTDIVDSTRRAAELGDGRWRTLLEEHFVMARRAIERFGGREIKTTGDGLVATFDGPARAIRAAASIRDAVRELGLEIRAALHTGEIEIQGTDIAGLAVHIAARILGLAGPGEVVVSGTVHDLVVGSGFNFEDRGTHELKGVPGSWRAFALAEGR